MFSNSLAVYLGQYVKTEFLASIISFLLLFIVTLLIGAVLNYIISHLAQKTGLSLPDRILGAVFGVMRGVMISLLIVFLVANTSWQKQRWFTKSTLNDQLQTISSWMQDKVIEVSKVTAEIER